VIGRSLFPLLVGALALGLTTAAAPGQDVSKYPDWSGQWKKPDGLGNGQWDPTKPRNRGQQAPLTPEYQAIYEARLADRAQGGRGGDPTGACIPHGMPRMMIGVYPMEIVITPKATYILSDYNEPRRIYTDGRNWPKEIEGSFLGYSIGNWTDTDGDGRYDTLNVETRGFKGPRTFEGSGIPLHDDGQSIIKERFSLDKANKDSMHIEVTTIDHALTRPWTIVRPFEREHNPIWMTVDCSEDNHQLYIQNESYMLSGEGYLMPTKKGQAPPDLRYFKQAK
jgi:hypothetical protein